VEEEDMKKTLLALALMIVIVGAAASLFAQTSDEIELTREVIRTQKKAIVAANMGLTEEESQAFWPVYNDFQNDLRKVNDRVVKLITAYASEYETLTDERSQEMLVESMSIDKDTLALRESYLEKFSAVLPAKKVVRYYQIENKLEAIIDYDLADNIPLVEVK
jgi:hypothetical protein